MAWTYADWEEQSTPAAQLVRLKQFRTELRSAIGARVEEDGVAWDPAAINALLAATDRDLERLQREADAASGVGLPRMISTTTSRRAY